MGFQALVGGRSFRLESFSAVEAATPLSATDSSGQVGTITLNLVAPDPFLVGTSDDVRDYSPAVLMGQSVRLTDSRKGFTLGRVVGTGNTSGGIFSLTCESRLGELNIYNVQAQPFVGRLEDAFRSYVALAGVSTDVFVDPSIASKPVVFPGWQGELWYHLKQMALAMEVDLSLVSGIILLRPIRARVAVRGRDVDRSQQVGGSLAQFVEVYHYDNQAINNQLVYPAGGWTSEVTVIHANSGEYVEQVLTLSSSLSSIQQPIMQTFVSQAHSTSSVYTVVGDDGLPISPSAFADYGGSLSVVINPDTTSLTIRFQAPSGLPGRDGAEIGVYGLALTSDSDSGRYSTLRIVGSGVSFNKQPIRVATGVPASQTGTEVGATVDNPYLGSIEQVYRAASWAVRQYSGRSMSISGTVTAVNQLGDSGVATYPSYQTVQGLHAGRTYDQVQTIYAGKSYAEVQDLLFASVQDDFENQVFGNVNGARVWDQKTHRWYRVREATLNADLISFTADDDLTHADYQGYWQGRTYLQVQTALYGRTYSNVDLIGMVLNG